MVKIIYKTGDKVFAKVKGYPPWPARVEGDTGKKKYNVLFYGTQETGAIKPEDLCYYMKNKDNYVSKYLKRAGYEDAVKQIEEAIKNDGGDGHNGDNDEDDVTDTASATSSVDKKVPKRKVTSLPDGHIQKKQPSTPRRKSMATVESKEDADDEPPAKRPRRKSIGSSDNGTKEINETVQDEHDEGFGDIKPQAELKPVETDSTKEQDLERSDEIEVEKSKTENSGLLNKKEEKKEDIADPKEKTLGESKEDTEENKKPKETEFVEIKNNIDDNLEMEEEVFDELDKGGEETTMKVEIVTEQMLQNNILYAEHVKKNVLLYKDKPVENRQDSQNQILPVMLPSETICGVKLHKEWPLNHTSEYERALYDEQVAKSLLEIKDQLTNGKSLNEVDAVVIPDIQMTLEGIRELTHSRDIALRKKRVARLRREADIVTWDAKIKHSLGLDKAFPEAALDYLKQYIKLEKDLDALTFIKHPHVLDTIRRLRKYVGNVNEWEMTEEDKEDFIKQAESIRHEAEMVYYKVKRILKITGDATTFWDTFLERVEEFRLKCTDMGEPEILVLCAEPDSRQTFFHRLDDVADAETAVNTSNTTEPVVKDTSVQGWSEKKSPRSN